MPGPDMRGDTIRNFYKINYRRGIYFIVVFFHILDYEPQNEEVGQSESRFRFPETQVPVHTPSTQALNETTESADAQAPLHSLPSPAPPTHEENALSNTGL